MNLAIVCQNVVRTAGHGRVNYQVAKKAAQRGHHVFVLSDSIAPDLRDIPTLTWVPINVQAWPSQLIRDQVFAWRSAQWFKQNQSEVDLTMATGFVTWAPVDVCMVQFVHNSWIQSPVHTWRVQGGVYGAYHYMYSFINAYLEKNVFQETQSLIAVSNAIQDELLDLGIPEHKISVIHNGVNLEEFQPGQEDRVPLRLPPHETLALFAGDIRTPRKNLDTVLHAIAKLPDVHLAVAGDTDGSPYPELARKLRIENRVHFLGFRNDIPQLMRAADFFVFPSRYEACALVLVEALASGLPVITAQTTGGSEIIERTCGIKIDDPNDVEALTHAMKELTTSKDTVATMSHAARKTALSYNFDNVADTYVDLLEKRNQLNG